MPTAKKLVLPADVYDTLELAALANGGVGRGQWFAEIGSYSIDPNCPVCHNGLAVFAGLPKPDGGAYDILDTPTNATGVINYWSNDGAVDDLVSQGRYTEDERGLVRVTWEDFCTELNIIRGD